MQIIDRHTIAIPGPDGPAGPKGERGLPGVNAVPADEAVAGYVNASGSATREAVVPRANTGRIDVVLKGTDGGFGTGSRDESPHLTFQSWQSPHNFGDPANGGVANIGGYGQAIRLDVMQPLAKNLIVWRGPKDPRYAFNATTNPLIDKLWMGWHHMHQNSDGSANFDTLAAHQHWSIETADENGDIQTRFQIKTHDVDNGQTVGLKVARIITTASDFVHVSSAETGAAFRLVGSASAPTSMEWSTTQAGVGGKRWALETSGTNMARLALRRYDGPMPIERHVFVADRNTGLIALGADAPADKTRMLVSYSAGDHIGVRVTSLTTGDNSGAAFQGEHTNSAHALIRGKIGNDTEHRFTARLNGRLEWGAGGTTAPDTTLYRHSAGRLTTDGDLNVAQNLRVGAANTAGGMVGGVVLTNAPTLPSSNVGNGGFLYAEGGALKWRGSSGTVTTIAPA